MEQIARFRQSPSTVRFLPQFLLFTFALIFPGNKIMGRRILVGESKSILASQLCERLQDGFEAESVAGACAFRIHMLERNYSVALIGLDLSQEDRLALIRDCKRLSPRTRLFVYFSPLPVHERIRTLEAGADDYVMQPFNLDELFTRVRVLTRNQDWDVDASISAGALELYQNEDQILFEGMSLDLPLAEQRLLKILMVQFGRLVDKEIIERTLGDEVETLTTNTVEQRVSRLRKTLDGLNSKLKISTVRGMGYVLEHAKNACFAITAFAADSMSASLVEVASFF